MTTAARACVQATRSSRRTLPLQVGGPIRRPPPARALSSMCFARIRGLVASSPVSDTHRTSCARSRSAHDVYARLLTQRPIRALVTLVDASIVDARALLFLRCVAVRRGVRNQDENIRSPAHLPPTLPPLVAAHRRSLLAACRRVAVRIAFTLSTSERQPTSRLSAELAVLQSPMSKSNRNILFVKFLSPKQKNLRTSFLSIFGHKVQFFSLSPSHKSEPFARWSSA